jgi:hypothetical protein
MWSSSSIPTEAAWAVLKRDDMSSLPPELESQMQSFYEQIPDEQQEKLEQLGQAIERMEPETKHKIKTMLMQTIMHNADKMPDILQDADPSNLFGLQQTEPGTFKVDGASVKKAFFVPLLIGAVFAADGINQSQGAKASIVGNGLMHTGAALGLNDPPKTSAFEYESDVASFQDPFLGIELGRAENPSWWQRAGAGALGLMQGLSLGVLSGKPVRAAVSSKRSAMAADKAGRVGDKISAIPEGRKGLRGMGDNYKKRKLTEQQTRLQSKSKRLADRAAKPSSRGLEGARRIGQATAGDPRAKGAVAPFIAGALNTGGSPNISGTASATPSGGAAGTGVANIGNRAAMGHADKQIWSGELDRKLGGGYGTNAKKGDNMKIGEQILKETKERMDKAHCMGDTEKKGDKKGSKKPAHGMIIVLGAQGTGPGPSKDGKRTKK